MYIIKASLVQLIELFNQYSVIANDGFMVIYMESEIKILKCFQ